MQNTYSLIQQAIAQLFNASGGFFVNLAISWFSIVGILIVMLFGAETVITGHFDSRKFVRMAFLLGVCSVMIHYWTTATPIFGMSVSSIVTNESASLSTQLEAGSNQQFADAMAAEYANTQVPGFFDLNMNMVYYVIVFLAVNACQLLLLGVTGFGAIAVGICLLLGPLFIVTLIVPGLDEFFWGWLRAFIQYSLYNVVAAAMTYVITTVMLGFLKQNPGTITLDQLPILGVQFAVTCGVCAYSIVKVPSLANSICTGRSGETLIGG